MTVSSDVDAATAAAFDSYMKRFPELYQELANCVVNNVPLRSGVVLDLGAGTGLLTVELQRQFPNGIVVGVEPLPTMLRLARENGKHALAATLNLVQGVSEALPFRSESVHGIVTRFSLPYWKQPKVSFQEMYRVLKPGGVVILQGLNKKYPLWKRLMLRASMRLRDAPRNVVTYHLDAYKLAHTRAWVEKMFIQTGFTIVESSGYSRDWQFLVVARKSLV